jgi:hypothetical protein
MFRERSIQGHLLSNRGFIPLRPLSGSYEFAGPFLEYFLGSWFV